MNLSSLNSQQKKAVTTITGPVLIFAGPGAGKTKMLTHRIAYLLSEGTKPDHILAVTFTNKAAQEMKYRVQELLRPPYADLKGFHIGTFHATSSKILRQEASSIGFPSTFTIYDRADQLSLVKRIAATLGVNNDRITPASMLSKISRAKSQLIAPADFLARSEDDWERLIGQFYQHYQKELARAYALDFDDLIMKTVELFEEHKHIREKWQDAFRYILVDEFQDTDIAQSHLINILASKHRNICVVGDEAQGIYSFRSADFRNILTFNKHYPDAKIIKLERNYRSTKTILEAASSLITHNEMRAQKSLWTNNKKGQPIHITETENEEAEAQYITKKIKKLQTPRSEIAILFRTNAQSRPLEEALIKQGIAYRTVGLTRFYDRKEVKDILAYLRVFHNPADSVSLSRILNVPPRGLGLASAKTIVPYQHELLQTKRIPQELREKLTPRAAKSLERFLTLFEGLELALRNTALASFITHLIKEVDYKKLIKKATDKEEKEANLQEFISIASDYKKNANEALPEFLERASLYGHERQEGQGQGIWLMTIHAAKGLEFLTVFISGLEYGVFPHYKSLGSQEGLEEERRLAYVAITRAKEVLFLTYARMRRIYGNTQANPPSNFLEEIPEELVIQKKL